jgi:hypothetical protein
MYVPATVLTAQIINPGRVFIKSDPRLSAQVVRKLSIGCWEKVGHLLRRRFFMSLSPAELLLCEVTSET